MSQNHGELGGWTIGPLFFGGVVQLESESRIAIEDLFVKPSVGEWTRSRLAAPTLWDKGTVEPCRSLGCLTVGQVKKLVAEIVL